MEIIFSLQIDFMGYPIYIGWVKYARREYKNIVAKNSREKICVVIENIDNSGPGSIE